MKHYQHQYKMVADWYDGLIDRDEIVSCEITPGVGSIKEITNIRAKLALWLRRNGKMPKGYTVNVKRIEENLVHVVLQKKKELKEYKSLAV